MKYNTEQIITILRHCGNQGNACPCADCILKDKVHGSECMDMYNVAADEIEENEKIINDLTRAICTKDEEIKKLKCQLANTNGGKINERNFV